MLIKASKDIKRKWFLAKGILKNKKIKYIAIPISGKRPVWLNKILPLASSSSPHITGDAIDLFILPLNKIPEIILALEEVEKINPELNGGIGAYNKNSWWNGMVHIDTTRKNTRWGYGLYPDFPEDYYQK